MFNLGRFFKPKRIIAYLYWCIIMLLSLFTVNAVFANTIFTVNDKPRVMTLSPNLTELAFSAGLGNQLVGVSDYSDYPEQATLLPRIADSQGIHLEQIIQLKPDIIIAQTGMISSASLDKLTASDISVKVVNINNSDELLSVLTELATFTTDLSAFKKVVTQVRQQLDVLAKLAPQSSPQKTVFLQFSDNPLLTISHQTLLSQLLEKCGLDNVFLDQPMPWPNVSVEGVISMKPDIIMLVEEAAFQQDKQNVFKVVSEAQLNQIHSKSFKQYSPYLPNKQVMLLNPDIFSRETVRLVDGVVALCQAVYNTNK